MNTNCTLRYATPADAEALVAIYAPYVQKTAITYEYEVPSPAEFRRRIETYSAKYPYLVAESAGIPVGYAYACPLGSRPAFDWAVETAIYIREDCKGLGIGRALYAELEDILMRQGIRTLTAAVASVAHEDPYLTDAPTTSGSCLFRSPPRKNAPPLSRDSAFFLFCSESFWDSQTLFLKRV